MIADTIATYNETGGGHKSGVDDGGAGAVAAGVVAEISHGRNAASASATTPVKKRRLSIGARGDTFQIVFCF